jgi:uncharacterized protein
MSTPAIPPLCLYHADCDDGFGAAWVVRKYFREAELDEPVHFLPVNYGQDPPDVMGRDLIIVDFSYKRPVMEVLCGYAKSILVLDHHKTAEEELRFMPEPECADWRFVEQDNLKCAVFDMKRSGAGLAWDFFFPLHDRPSFIDYLEDRDLWRKRMKGCDAFSFALRAYPHDFEVWDGLLSRGAGSLIPDGLAIERYYKRRVAEMVQQAFQVQLVAQSHLVGQSHLYITVALWAANVPRMFASEVAGGLAELNGIGVTFCQRGDGKWEYSLRARGKADVLEIVKEFGGGGHAQAAGFVVDSPAHVLVRQNG